jgi:hypothetical protein
MTSGEQVVGVLALHVDDAIDGGTEEFHGVMAKIGETLAVRSHDTSNFRYKGLRVSTVFKEEQTVFEINVDGDDYWLLVGLCMCLWATTQICCRRSR